MQSELVPMTQRDVHRSHTLRLVLTRRLTGQEAASAWGRSLRQTRRLLAGMRLCEGAGRGSAPPR